MTFTNSLKTQVDAPVWEWMRAVPVISAAAMAMTDLKLKGSRYIYYLSLASLYRYDTITDSWMQLATAAQTPVTLLALEGSPHCGYCGRVIAAGSTSSKTQIAALTGETLVGYKIRILSGKGMGQERTITDVSEPTIHDIGNTTTGAVTSITDTNAGILKRNWLMNQWRDYQVRITVGTGATQVRRILSNTPTVLTVADYNWSAIEPAYYAPFSTAPAAGSLYQIESSIITVDAPWTTEPDSTSRFLVKSGGLFAISSLAATPYYSWQYYDCAADVWHTKSAYLTLFNNLAAAYPTDASLVVMRDLDASIDYGSVTGGSIGSSADYTVSDSSKSWTQGRYANYAVNVTETATGITQSRTILYNSSNKIWVTDRWDTVPAGTGYTYTITPDTDKIYSIGGGAASMYQYSIDRDTWTPSRVYDQGIARGFCAQLKGGGKNAGRAVALSAGTRLTQAIVSVAVGAGGTNYKVDDLLAVAGGTGAGGVVRVTSVDKSTGAVTGVQLEETGTTNYGASSPVTVATTGGAGSSCTVAITLGAVAKVTPVIGTFPLKLGDVITVTGDTSTGNYYNVTDATIIGITSTTIAYAANASIAASATFNAQSATVLYDYAQSWTVNEHKNKYILIAAVQSGNQGVVTQCRKIASNDATSITVTGNITAAVNGTSRYTIIDPKPFGTEDTFKNDITRNGGLSLCTGIDAGATAKTSLSDSTKSWVTNFWKDNGPRKIRILAGPNFGAEIAVTANTSNTLYFGAQSNEMTTETLYCIMDNYGVASGSGSTTTIVDSAHIWKTGVYVGKRVKMLAVNTDTANHGVEFQLTAIATSTLTTGSTLTSTVAGTSYAILGLTPRSTGNQLIWIYDPSTGDGVTSDTTKTGRYFISFRGGATNEINKYDICTETWDILSYYPQFTTFTTGAMYAYDHKDRVYIASENATALMTGRVFYYDFVKNRMEQGGQAPYGFGTGVLSNRMAIVETIDGLKYLYLVRNSDSVFWRMLIFW